MELLAASNPEAWVPCAAGTTRFLRLMTDFFMVSGLCTPCSLWYNPVTISQESSDLFRRRTTSIANRMATLVSSPQRGNGGSTVLTCNNNGCVLLLDVEGSNVNG
jgi:hypothetical protein